MTTAGPQKGQAGATVQRRRWRLHAATVELTGLAEMLIMVP